MILIDNGNMTCGKGLPSTKNFVIPYLHPQTVEVQSPPLYKVERGQGGESKALHNLIRESY
jgi:hypothetical protein